MKSPADECSYRVTAGCCGPFRLGDVLSQKTAASLGHVPTLLAQGVLEVTTHAPTRSHAADAGSELENARAEAEAVRNERDLLREELAACEAACVRLRDEAAARSESDRAIEEQIREVNAHSATLTQERDDLALRLAVAEAEAEKLKGENAKLHADLEGLLKAEPAAK